VARGVRWGGAASRPRRQRDYKAEYARRVAGTAPGTRERQEKRGHKLPPGKSEYQVKKDRFEARLLAFAEKQAFRWPGEDRTEAIADALRAQVAVEGRRFLGRIEAKVRELEERLAAGSTGAARRSLGIGMSGMEALSEEYQLPVETFGYH
jgi:hypothetical protein